MPPVIYWLVTSGMGANDGKVCRVTPAGDADIIIDSLPSFFNVATNAVDGALGAWLADDGIIYVMQGGGPDPLSSSILQFSWEDYLTKGSPLLPQERNSAIMVGEWALANGYIESNPYSSFRQETGDLIIADAAANAVFRYHVNGDSLSVVADMPSTPNPTPIGPPFIEPVPSKVLPAPDGNGFLVATYTGFPFPDGEAKIYRISEEGDISIYLEGLTQAIDFAPNPANDDLFILQFARFGPDPDGNLNYLFGSAQLLSADAEGNLDTIASGFGPSAGLAVLPDGSVYTWSVLLKGWLLISTCISKLAFLLWAS
ncbi:MAG: ScyD/ScyE family protein [Bacteroidota bacterium]